jgi:hypothetical protein
MTVQIRTTQRCRTSDKCDQSDRTALDRTRSEDSWPPSRSSPRLRRGPLRPRYRPKPRGANDDAFRPRGFRSGHGWFWVEETAAAVRGRRRWFVAPAAARPKSSQLGEARSPRRSYTRTRTVPFERRSKGHSPGNGQRSDEADERTDRPPENLSSRCARGVTTSIFLSAALIWGWPRGDSSRPRAAGSGADGRR